VTFPPNLLILGPLGCMERAASQGTNKIVMGTLLKRHDRFC
jgi:hypothetical protein